MMSVTKFSIASLENMSNTGQGEHASEISDLDSDPPPLDQSATELQYPDVSLQPVKSQLPVEAQPTIPDSNLVIDSPDTQNSTPKEKSAKEATLPTPELPKNTSAFRFVGPVSYVDLGLGPTEKDRFLAISELEVFSGL